MNGALEAVVLIAFIILIYPFIQKSLNRDTPASRPIGLTSHQLIVDLEPFEFAPPAVQP